MRGVATDNFPFRKKKRKEKTYIRVHYLVGPYILSKKGMPVHTTRYNVGGMRGETLLLLLRPPVLFCGCLCLQPIFLPSDSELSTVLLQCVLPLLLFISMPHFVSLSSQSRLCLLLEYVCIVC